MSLNRLQQTVSGNPHSSLQTPSAALMFGCSLRVVDVSIFFIFLVGGSSSWQIPGGGSPGRVCGEGARVGGEGVCGEFGGGGRADFFFWGAEIPTKV